MSGTVPSNVYTIIIIMLFVPRSNLFYSHFLSLAPFISFPRRPKNMFVAHILAMFATTALSAYKS